MQLRLLWDRPNRPATATAITSTLLIGCRPERGPAPGCDLHLVIDVSTSMGSGGKLEGAKQACRMVLAGLRDADACAISSFASTVTPLVPLTTRSHLDMAQVLARIDAIQASGVTLMDHAIEQARATLGARPDPSRPATLVLVTDGDPTDPDGGRLTEFDVLHRTAATCGEQGISVVAIGVGSGNDFNGDLLERLADLGRGALCHAGRGDDLAALLGERLGRSQSMASATTELRLQPLGCSARVVDVCRMTPEYVHLALGAPATDGTISLSAGALAAGAETVCLAAVETTGQFGISGPQPVLSVTVDAGAGERAEGTANLSFTADRRAQQAVEQEASLFRDRRNLVTLNERVRQARDPRATGELLQQVRDLASALGEDNIAQGAAERLEELAATGQVSADSNMRDTVQIRRVPVGFGTGEVRLAGEAVTAPAEGRPPLARSSARLSVRAGVRPAVTYSLDRPELGLGRGAANDIDLAPQEPDGAAPRVSRTHARITWEGETCWIEDLGSTNGTEVDGVSLAAGGPRAQVRKGTRIRLGGVVDLEAQSD